MNIQETFGDGEAKIDFRDGEFIVVKPGGHVRCAVTGVKIPLQALKYWSVDKQEAYADADAALKGMGLRP